MQIDSANTLEERSLAPSIVHHGGEVSHSGSLTMASGDGSATATTPVQLSLPITELFWEASAKPCSNGRHDAGEFTSTSTPSCSQRLAQLVFVFKTDPETLYALADEYFDLCFRRPGKRTQKTYGLYGHGAPPASSNLGKRRPKPTATHRILRTGADE
jgi:hypothetical protein